MAKKITKNAPQAASAVSKPVEEPVIQQHVSLDRKPFKFNIFEFKSQAIIVALLAFICYINTIGNEFAHDDGIVIVKNEYVLEGFAGLKGIFTKDAYDSYYRQLNTINQLSGGRYRPLSIATFAIEQQFFGTVSEDRVDSVLKESISYGIRGPAEKQLVQNMHIRHLFNVFWYMACVLVLLYFLHYIVFKDIPIAALVAAVLFTAHPIHTEVVANVKSRDEIMSLLFICSTFIFAFKYDEYKKLPLLGFSLLSLFLAFLSKEYAVTLVFLVPFSLYLFREYPIVKSLKASLPYVGVFLLYVFIRLKIAISTANVDTESMGIDEIIKSVGQTSANADKEVLNNPYVFATASQKIATEIATSLNYIKLLIFPHPLSADYSYNSIPYKEFSHPLVLLSVAVHLALMAAGVFFAINRKKFKILAFAIAFYILHLLLINNLIFNIGATMGERLIFHSSVGFCVAIAFLLWQIAVKMNNMQLSLKIAGAVTGIIVLFFSIATIARNPKWKNDRALFMEDIKVVPNSVLVLGNVAAAYITMSDYEANDTVKKQYLNTAVRMLDHAIELHPKFVAGFLNQGIGYFKMGELDSAKMCLDSVKKNYPNYPTLRNLYTLLGDYYMKNGWNKYGKFGKYPEAIREFQQGIAIDSTNPELWYNLGGAYFTNKQYQEAVNAWNMTIKLNPNHEQARAGMNAAMGQLTINKPMQGK